MFKTDDKSLEALSFSFTDDGLANFKFLLDYLKRKDLLTIGQEEFQAVMETIDKVGELKLNGKVYAFHVYDSFAEMNGPPDGVELYLRHGNSLDYYYQSSDRYSVPTAEECSQFLKKRNMARVYTGQIPYNSAFLDLPYTNDPDDPITRDILNRDEIDEFKSNGIEVVVLDSLI